MQVGHILLPCNNGWRLPASVYPPVDYCMAKYARTAAVEEEELQLGVLVTLEELISKVGRSTGIELSILVVNEGDHAILSSVRVADSMSYYGERVKVAPLQCSEEERRLELVVIAVKYAHLVRRGALGWDERRGCVKGRDNG